MAHTNPRSLGIAGMALLLGILGDALLRATPWGLNVPIWMGVAVVGGWSLTPGHRQADITVGGWPVLLALFFAACIAWRDSRFLTFWNGVAVLAALTLVVMQARGVRLGVGRMLDYANGALAAGANTASGALSLSADDLRWHQVSRHGRYARSAVIGLLLSIPLLLLFGGLLASADPGFERLVRATVDIDFSTLGSHLLLGGFITWIVAGYLVPIITTRDGVFNALATVLQKTRQKPSLGILELGIPLGALALIFLVFVALQARYLFGGEAVILATAGLTYAEYARTGFFELVAAATLLVPVLLGADWLLDPKADRDHRVFRGLSAALLILIGLMMLSAIQRMSLYVDAYGLTEDRFYATAFMGWIGAVLAYFAATVLRGRRNRFAFGSVAAAFGLLAVLNVANPDSIIMRVNLARAEAGKDFDVRHAARLSADGVPALISGLPGLSPDTRCEAWQSAKRETANQTGDWRTWNLSRSRAKRVVAARGEGCD